MKHRTEEELIAYREGDTREREAISAHLRECADCGEEWCADCLVPPVKKRQPLRCVDCALIAAGIRSRGRSASPMNMSLTQRRPTSLF